MGLSEHNSVMWQASLDALQVQPDGFYVDGTFGRGGHSRGILDALGSEGVLMAIDQDPQAAKVAIELQKEWNTAECSQFRFFKGQFAQAVEAIEAVGKPLNGVLLDLGVSSPQLDQGGRGFSFQQPGPLDMRMNCESGETLADKLAEVSQETLADVLFQLGEERYSRRIAKAIVLAQAEGRLESTLDLANVIKAAHPKWPKGKHPATKSFLALRIWVNDELAVLEKALKQFRDLLAPGGRLVVISFHSLEDRVVKQFFKSGGALINQDDAPAWLPIGREGQSTEGVRTDAVRHSLNYGNPLKIVSKPRKASEAEQQENPRSRSALLRVAEKR